MTESLAEVTRGSWVEAVHEGSVVVATTSGDIIAWSGDPDTRRFFRSSAKPFQAIPVVADGAADAFGLTPEELALCCASHNATPRHQAVVQSILDKIGLAEPDLACGFTPPLDEEEKARVTLGLVEQTQIRCECSGEHAGMLAACRHADWPVENYIDAGHPLQQEIRAIVASACGLAPEDLELATDGCSIPTFGAPLRSFAIAYGVMADPVHARWDAPESWRSALLRLRDAMVRHPELLSGKGEIDTTIMQHTEGRVIGKLGAEGLLCLAIPEHGLGIAISDSGGSTRSLGPAAIAVLEQLSLEGAGVLAGLREELCPPISSFKGAPVGETRPVLTLQRT